MYSTVVPKAATARYGLSGVTHRNYVCMCTYIYIYTYDRHICCRYACVYIYMPIYIYIYIYIHIYIYIAVIYIYNESPQHFEGSRTKSQRLASHPGHVSFLEFPTYRLPVVGNDLDRLCNYYYHYYYHYYYYFYY